VYVSTQPEQVFLQDGRIVPFEDGLGGADCLLSILPTPTKQHFQGSNEEIAAAMSGIFAGFAASAFAASFEGPHILVFHGAIGGASLPNNQLLIGKDIEISVDQLALGNFDIVCLGHIHLPQQLGKDGQPGGNAFYSGSLFPTNWGEAEHKHGFWIHQIEKESPMPELNYSEFVETPHKRLVRIKEDWTNDQPQEPISLDGMDGAYVRYDITCWQDEAAGIDKEAIKKSFTEAGALDVDIRINRIPRENVRAEAVLKAESLRDKLVRQAELRGETVDPSILVKADELETVPMEELIEGATGERKVAA
jgi:DNA repair exonuclease SbcCD nuclease subunit